MSSYQASFRQTLHSHCSLNTTSLASKWLWQTQERIASVPKASSAAPALCPSGRQGCSAANLCCIWSSQPKLVGHQLAPIYTFQKKIKNKKTLVQLEVLKRLKGSKEKVFDLQQIHLERHCLQSEIPGDAGQDGRARGCQEGLLV